MKIHKIAQAKNFMDLTGEEVIVRIKLDKYDDVEEIEQMLKYLKLNVASYNFYEIDIVLSDGIETPLREVMTITEFVMNENNK